MQQFVGSTKSTTAQPLQGCYETTNTRTGHREPIAIAPRREFDNLKCHALLFDTIFLAGNQYTWMLGDSRRGEHTYETLEWLREYGVVNYFYSIVTDERLSRTEQAVITILGRQSGDLEASTEKTANDIMTRRGAGEIDDAEVLGFLQQIKDSIDLFPTLPANSVDFLPLKMQIQAPFLQMIA